MRRPILTLAALATAALAAAVTPAAADLCAWNPKPVVETAMTFVKRGATIQEYCLPCRDTAAKASVVSAVDLKQVDTQSWQLQVNGKGVDLAYVYVPDQNATGTWTNLGLLAKCGDVDEQDVPRLLPRSVVAR